MSNLIKNEISKVQNIQKKVKDLDLSDDRAFSYLLLKYAYEVEDFEQDDCVTDGTNDGGVDFLYFDEDESKLIAGQSKYTKSLKLEDVVKELGKMYSTLMNFKDQKDTGLYNARLRKALQNDIDRLSEDNFNIELAFFTTADNIQASSVFEKIKTTKHAFHPDIVKIYTKEDIEKFITDCVEKIKTVKEADIEIDYADNVLSYESDNNKGIMCNVSSASIAKLFNQYEKQGLFDLNIRKYIRKPLIDGGIKKTIKDDRSNFWFLNNGLIIACRSYDVAGKTVKVNDFSIVNGGQTTTLIGRYGSGDRFFVPCKIVASKKTSSSMDFFTKIAEATNSQKPILPRDLKSNAPEMLRMSKLLADNQIYLEIKRGVTPDKNIRYSIKNDELAQLILSFAHQKPGTSRSGKKLIFENNDLYALIFKEDYSKDDNKKEFLLDLVDLYDRYKKIEKKLKKDGLKEDSLLTDAELDVLKNGTQIIFAILGLLYRLNNNGVKEKDLLKNASILQSKSFEYAAIFSQKAKKSKKTIDVSLENLIRCILENVADNCDAAISNGKATSVSNFFKTDKKYVDDIVVGFAKGLRRSTFAEEINKALIIFKR